MSYQKNNQVNIDLEKFRYVKSKKKVYLGLALATVFVLAWSMFIVLTPFTIYSPSFRFLLILLAFMWSLPLWFRYTNPKLNKPIRKSPFILPLILGGGLIVLFLLLSIISAPIFIANDYRELIHVQDNGNFVESVEDYTTMQIPIVDRDLAIKLGDKKLGEDNLGSQYFVGEYTMINYADNLYWVAPIEFDGFFKWVNAKTSPGYVKVNANNQSDVQIVKAELKYIQSAYLLEDLARVNYFSNLTVYKENAPHLELDNHGNPMFVESVFVNRFMGVSGKDVVGCIITDPKTGNSMYYDVEITPDWVDHIQTEDIVIEQLNYYGAYVNGFFNSVFAKRDMLMVSAGSNYVFSDGEMYLQTGMTSVGGDESIVGVVMVDMRTKKTVFCKIGGATEWAAAQSAIGSRKAQNYTASAPIMINVAGIPTYFVMLKDNEGLVKEYSYVNVADYSTVSTNSIKEQALADYKTMVLSGGEAELDDYKVLKKEQVVTGGETYYYFKLEKILQAGETDTESDLVFVAPVKLNSIIPFIEINDIISISSISSGDEQIITDLEIKIV